MTSALVRWVNIPTSRTIFMIRHSNEGGLLNPNRQECLFILGEYEKIDNSDNFFLMTERVRTKSKFSGLGIAVEELPCLDDGDVVRYDGKDKRLEIVFQSRSKTNSLYVTNACNSRCQFCPQPSSVDHGELFDECMDIVKLVGDAGEIVNVSGGEPTLLRDRFVSFLAFAANKWSQTKLFVLTNGRTLKERSYVEEIFTVRNRENIGFGIPLYADAASVHDAVVGVHGAFGETIRGLLNLASQHAEIEIRFVVSKLNYKRLPRLVEFIGRNLPFITRIAVMGLEPMGYCREKWESFWIDPEECKDVLIEAVDKAANYNVSIFLYNMQLCCLPKQLHRFACASISEWKRVFIPTCDACPLRHDCGGFFASQNAARFLPRRFGK